MSKLTTKQYEHQASQCEGLCVIDHDRIGVDDPNVMPCVTCPFCKEIVNAILTPTTIACPECKTSVKR